MRKIHAFAIAFAIMCPFVFAEAQDGGGDPATIRPGTYGQHCEKIRRKAPPIKEGKEAKEAKTNDMVVYCSADFPWVMHCGTHGDEAGIGTTVMTKCPNPGKCSAIGERKNTGPQNQAIEIVEKTTSDGTVTGCWVYDLDHEHLPYTTEVICCRG